MSLENRRTTYKDLLDRLKEMDNLDDSVATAHLLLGRDLRKADIETDDVVSLTIIITSGVRFLIIRIGRKYILWLPYRNFVLKMGSKFRVFQ